MDKAPLRLMVQRRRPIGKNTPGDLYVDGVWECHTVEDLVRKLGPKGEGKIPGETAIPAGTYKVIINLSARFGKLMMRLLDVLWFVGILIHGGNTAEDTHGCILVGQKLTAQGTIAAGTSTPAITALFAKVQKALAEGREVWIEVKDAEEGA
ncbi:DUF5675 family protein [Geothrix sp. 21YS21S-2]|uniref:DUF5675 family protein n=1 Tax=Geothrix sp. 21YS21S-2 TaxID=3068893 RepID=UPI0027B9415C|nr:DUF5675 family protein [Geothrix sp. 21YS21S-2]